jgi:hypothetical protein
MKKKRRRRTGDTACKIWTNFNLNNWRNHVDMIMNATSEVLERVVSSSLRNTGNDLPVYMTSYPEQSNICGNEFRDSIKGRTFLDLLSEC